MKDTFRAFNIVTIIVLILMCLITFFMSVLLFIEVFNNDFCLAEDYDFFISPFLLFFFSIWLRAELKNYIKNTSK